MSLLDLKYLLWAAIGQFGRKVGLSMVTTVALWDVLMLGARHFMEYAIGYKGIVIILVGIYLIWKGDKIERNG